MQLLNMESSAIDPRETEAIRRRLVAIRKLVAGDNQAAFARRLGIKPNRWNNLERGFPLSLNIAFMLVKAVNGLTIGYITQGHTDRLPKRLRDQLSDLDEELFPSPPRRSSE